MSRIFSKPIVILALTALAFFYLTAWIGTPPGDIWNSPDETANAYWAEHVASREPLMLRDFAVGIGGGVVHPRSFDVYGSALVPGSFPGIFLLYGSLKFFTGLPLSAMTPFLTALAGLVLYALLKALFDRKTAFWSAFLFYLHPAVLYYSGRGLFHNLLFIDLAIFAAGFFALRPFSKGLESPGWTDDALAGLFLGFAVVTRASEAPWLLPAALAFVPFLGKTWWKRALAVAVGGLIPLFVLLSFNASTYGSLLGSAYEVPERAISVSETVATGAAAPSVSVLPFGFHPRLIFMHGMDYGLGIFWWYSLAGILGLTVFLMAWKRQEARKKVYLYVTAGITLWLLAFYGSWFVRDRYDPTLVTIGTSYVRYFLPIYVLTLPWVVQGLSWTADRLRLSKGRVLAALVVVFAVLSLRIAVTHGDESLLAVRETLRGNLEKRELLRRAIDSDGVVMTDRFDKVLFPLRMRVIPVADEAAFKAVPVLLQYVPVYWYGITPSEEEKAALAGSLADVGVTMQPGDPVVEGESLFLFTLQGHAQE